jgi:hypothetical protein
LPAKGEYAVVEIIRERPELAVWTVLILAVAVCYIAKVLSGHWRSVRQAEFESVLKEQMIKRGMSAREIVEVMQANSAATDLCPEEVRTFTGHHASSADKRWLWLAVGLPVALFVLCGGFMMAMASFAVVASDNAASILVEEREALPVNDR